MISNAVPFQLCGPTFIEKYKIPHLKYIPATRMLACHLQLDATQHTLHMLHQSIRSAFGQNPYSSKTNYVRSCGSDFLGVSGTQELK